MDCIDKIHRKLMQCSREEEEGCKECPVREECALWFSNVPAYITGKECSDYILKASALRGKKRRLKREHEREDDTGHAELHKDNPGRRL